MFVSNEWIRELVLQMTLVRDGAVIALAKLIGVESVQAHRLVSGCLANLTTTRDVTFELLRAKGHQVRPSVVRAHVASSTGGLFGTKWRLLSIGKRETGRDIRDVFPANCHNMIVELHAFREQSGSHYRVSSCGAYTSRSCLRIRHFLR